MRLVVVQYLPPNEWLVGVNNSGISYKTRIRALTTNEAEQIGEEMRAILAEAAKKCEAIARRTLAPRMVFFDD